MLTLINSIKKKWKIIIIINNKCTILYANTDGESVLCNY